MSHGWERSRPIGWWDLTPAQVLHVLDARVATTARDLRWRGIDALLIALPFVHVVGVLRYRPPLASLVLVLGGVGVVLARIVIHGWGWPRSRVGRQRELLVVGSATMVLLAVVQTPAAAWVAWYSPVWLAGLVLGLVGWAVVLLIGALRADESTAPPTWPAGSEGLVVLSRLSGVVGLPVRRLADESGMSLPVCESWVAALEQQGFVTVRRGVAMPSVAVVRLSRRGRSWLDDLRSRYAVSAGRPSAPV